MSSDASTDRLSQLQAELAQILEARLATVHTALQQTERTTRRIIAAELDIERSRSTQARLQAELKRLEAEVSGHAQERAAIESRHAEVQAQRDGQLEELARMEADVREADANTERTRRKLRSLEDEADSLREENANLKTKLRTIEENIARMRSLREEIMNSISEQTNQMKGLAGAGLD